MLSDFLRITTLELYFALGMLELSAKPGKMTVARKITSEPNEIACQGYSSANHEKSAQNQEKSTLIQEMLPLIQKKSARAEKNMCRSRKIRCRAGKGDA